MKAVIVGGGTGGHIIPVINIGRKLTRLGCSVVYIGSCFGIEYNMKIDMKKYFLPISGWVRQPLKNRLLFFPRLISSIITSIIVIYKENPKFVVLTGGFVTIPFIFVSLIFNKPIFLIEINSIPGFAAKITSYFAYITFIGFESSKKYLYHTKNVIFVGIPVSDKLGTVSRSQAAEFFGLKINKKTILIFGGSRGARKLNELGTEIANKLPKYQFIFLGRDDINNNRIKSFKFLNEMEYVYGISDFVISRAGAMTCGELLYLNKPAILIPYPFAYKNHQLYNAIELKKKMKDIYLITEENININKIVKILKNIKINSCINTKENPLNLISKRIISYVRRI